MKKQVYFVDVEKKFGEIKSEDDFNFMLSCVLNCDWLINNVEEMELWKVKLKKNVMRVGGIYDVKKNEYKEVWMN